MAEFTVRVELHGGSDHHYELLHSFMLAHGFQREIVGVDNSRARAAWRLPAGEYNYVSDASAAAVRDQVKVLADSVRPGAWVLVTKVAERAWTTQKLRVL